MTSDLSALVPALIGSLGLLVIGVKRAFQKAREDAERDAAMVEALRSLRPPMPSPPPLRSVSSLIDPSPMEDEYFIQHISKGRDNYGQVLESVRVSTGHRVPTMPRPAPTARCQWCRVKLTNGECVDGCGGHQ